LLASVLEECEIMTRILAERKGLDFQLSADADLPVEVYVDANRLQQVLINLISNAIKFLKDNNIDAIPVQGSPLDGLLEALPFNSESLQDTLSH